MAIECSGSCVSVFVAGFVCGGSLQGWPVVITTMCKELQETGKDKGCQKEFKQVFRDAF